MTEQNIQVNVGTRVTGKQELAEQTRAMDLASQGFSRFNEIKSEAAEKYPEDLKKQNKFLNDQLQLIRQLEQAENKSRMSELQHQEKIARQEVSSSSGREKGTKKRDLERIQAEIYGVKTGALDDATRNTESSAAAKQWALDQGVYDPQQRDSPGMIGDLTQSGMRGGAGGVATGAVQGVTGAVTRKMAGMGTGAKLATGLGVGVVGYAAFKGVQALQEGWTSYKDILKDLTEISAMSETLPVNAEAFRESFEAVALTTATSLSELAGLEKTWMRILGAGAGDPVQRRLDLQSTISLGEAYGIENAESTGFVAQQGKTGYEALADPTILKQAIAEGVMSGISVARLPEFLQEVMGVTQAVIQTAVTMQDPGMISRYAGLFGTMGEPFRGSRGGNVLSGLHDTMATGGMGFQAALRIMERGGQDFSIGQVTALQEQGMADPRMLTEFFGMARDMASGAGKDIERTRWDQSFLLKKWSGNRLQMAELYNPDKAMNSLVELMERFGDKLPEIGNMSEAEFATFIGSSSDLTDEEKKYIRGATSGGDEKDPPKTQAELIAETIKEGLQGSEDAFNKRIATFRDTFGFEDQQAAIAGEIGKIETAATAFESAASMMNDVVIAFARTTLDSDEAKRVLSGLPPTNDEATFSRRMGTLWDFIQSESGNFRAFAGAGK